VTFAKEDGGHRTREEKSKKSDKQSLTQQSSDGETNIDDLKQSLADQLINLQEQV